MLQREVQRGRKLGSATVFSRISWSLFNMSQESHPLIAKFNGIVDITTSSVKPGFRKGELLFSRWQSFSSVCMFVSIVGTTYAFAIFSALLQNDLGYSKSACDLIASIGTTGVYLSLVAGIFIERLGYKTVVKAGGVFIFIGFMFMFLAVKQWIPSNIYIVSFFYFISQVGVCCHIASAVAVSVKLFPPESHGVAIGLSKGYFGLSTAVLSNLAGGYFGTTPALFLIFVATVIPLIGMSGATYSNVLPPHLVSFDYERRNEISTSLNGYIIHWFILFFSLLFLGYIQYAYDLSDITLTILSAGLMCVVLSVQYIAGLHGDRIYPLEDCIPSEADIAYRRKTSFNTFKAQKRKNQAKIHFQAKPTLKTNTTAGSTTDSESEHWEDDGSDGYSDIEFLLPTAESSESVSTKDTARSSTVTDFEEACYYGCSLSLPESVRTWRIWGLFFTYLVTCGSGLMVIYNVYSIAESVGKSPSTFFVTLISLANGLGRVTAGLLSDSIIEACSLSKLQLLYIVVLLMSFTQTLLSFGSEFLLYPCFIGVGFLFGCTVSLAPINLVDIYGEKYIATNFGFVDTSPIIGSYIFATFSIDWFYHENTTTDDGRSVCIGSSCFRTCFIINALACLTAAFLIYYMHEKTPR